MIPLATASTPETQFRGDLRLLRIARRLQTETRTDEQFHTQQGSIRAEAEPMLLLFQIGREFRDWYRGRCSWDRWIGSSRRSCAAGRSQSPPTRRRRPRVRRPRRRCCWRRPPSPRGGFAAAGPEYDVGWADWLGPRICLVGLWMSQGFLPLLDWPRCYSRTSHQSSENKIFFPFKKHKASPSTNIFFEVSPNKKKSKSKKSFFAGEEKFF